MISTTTNQARQRFKPCSDTKSASLNWSLISLVNLLAFLFILYGSATFGTLSAQRAFSSWFLLVFHVLVLLSYAMFNIVMAILGDQWTVEDGQWAKLMGFVSIHYQRAPLAIGLLVLHIVLALISLFDIYGSRSSLEGWRHSLRSLLVRYEHIGFKLRFACCLLLPGIQLVVGISHPSWISLPYFIGSCIGLVDWSLTSNILGLFRWRNYLLPYAGSNIVLLYIYQLPMEFSAMFKWFAEFIGLYRISSSSNWSEACSGMSLMLFYIMIFLFALSYWSFHFASLYAFGLLAYVGYILYAFPSLFLLHRLNGLLLIFILFWATSTYIFNVAFTYFNKEIQEDMEIWETVGLWHFSVPGFYLFAQFCLGVLVALGNLVNGSVFFFLSNEDGKSFHVNPAVDVIFFMMYTLRPSIDRKMRQALVLLCETHFALLYILQLNLFSEVLQQEGSWPVKILSQLGLLDYASRGDCLKIVLLACFCAIHNHGFEMLFSFSAILQHAPSLPFGFSILKAGLNKSVLLSVYTSKSRVCQPDYDSHETRIAMYLGAIGKQFLSIYHSFGTYIAFLTILVTVYLVPPNYISFGYLFGLLLWITGRQIMGSTIRRLWLPLKAYSVAVFLFIYSLSVFFSFRSWLSKITDLYPAFGFNQNDSAFKNVWDSLAVLIVMQLHSYERRQSTYSCSDDHDVPDYNRCSLMRRLLILHNEKILLISLFYASLSPVSTFGLVYLFGLLISSTSPKSSQRPSKFFLVYSGILLMVDYLFQIWGGQARMFPGQKHYYVSQLIGLQLFKPGFWGLESGLRGKILVIFSCMLQYIVFRWVERLPGDLGSVGKWEEIFTLFGPANQNPDGISVHKIESKVDNIGNLMSHKQKDEESLLPSLNSSVAQGLDPLPFEGPKVHKVHPNRCLSESSEGAQKWNRKQVAILRKERLKTQKTLLKLYLKFWIENMFNLFGLEINMIALLLCSFALLNAISLLYVAALAACILLSRNVIQKLWPIFVFSFASVLMLEYLAVCRNLASLKLKDMWEPQTSCHDCWKNSNVYFDYCLKCWLGVIVDDHRMLISYWAVFMLSCFKLRADQLSSLSMSYLYQQILSISKNTCVFSDLSFETKCIWTSLDYLRLESYCHLLDFVLSLILVTGTLEYDILHLGYLGFALVFFRMRLEILKKKNQIFRCLRIYNFALIILSLAYQSPFVGASTDEKCETSEYIYKIIGFYKYDYGFRITSRSALVEIIIFGLISLQSYMFASKEFDYVSKYLEEEQIRAILSEQEKKAAWKTKQLLHIRRVEELKHQRNMQVEKMKAEMLNLQTKLHRTVSDGDYGDILSQSESLGRRRMPSVLSPKESSESCKEENPTSSFNSLNFEITEAASLKILSPTEMRDQIKDSPQRFREHKENNISDLDDLDENQKEKQQNMENPLMSAVHIIGDGVSHVQSIRNLAVNNLASLLNIDIEEMTSEENNDGNGVYDEVESQNMKCPGVDLTASMHSDGGFTEALHAYVSMLLRYIWAQMRSHNDIVCYCCFVLIFIWNFSLLSIVYLLALFLYALCVHDGPSSMFWRVMLIYTEFCILVQYLYQITFQQCGFSIQLSFLRELGFPEHKMTSSFVTSIWPFFLVYLFTLLQSSISARDSEWTIAKDFGSFRKRNGDIGESWTSSNWLKKVERLLFSFGNVIKLIMGAIYSYWQSLTEGAETPPYFVQLSMRVEPWPVDGIQAEKLELRVNKLLEILHVQRCKDKDQSCHTASRIRVQSIEQSPESPNIALAVLEVIYASSLVEGIPLEWHHSLTPAADVAEEFLEAQRAGIFEEIGFPYPVLSVIWGGKREIDLYACVFCADLVVFFLVAIFYQSVIKSNSEFLEVYQLEDQFPKEFVYILMVIFFLIVLDRVIYLCIFPRGKVMFYIFNLALFTCVVTKYAWSMDPSHQHAGAFALRAIYFMKAISLALQAVQIRYGIPNKGTLYQQFLTSSVSRINYVAFRIYRALPFLHELRCVLDWSCTTTSLTMYDWLKLEDIHSSLFLVKCDVDLNRAKHLQGHRQTKMTKFCNGICLFLVLICAIWTPMLMYSSGNPTNIANPIKDASVRVEIKTVSGRLTLFETTLCEKLSWRELGLHTNLDPHGYLSTYDQDDIQLISCQTDASSMWLVPPVVQARFVQSLNWGVDVIFSWQFIRDRPKEKEVVKYELVVQHSDSPKAEQVMEVLNGTANIVRIYDIYPRYFRVTGSGDVRLLEDTVETVSANLMLHKGNPGWWSFHDIDPLRVGDYSEPTGPVAVVISEETPQGILGDTLSHFSIWGLYVTFVLALGRFIRLQFSDLRMRIPYENLPSCDRLLAICENIYTSRAEGELEVEEVLYWTLVKIYRSPHMLLEYTKPD